MLNGEWYNKKYRVSTYRGGLGGGERFTSWQMKNQNQTKVARKIESSNVFYHNYSYGKAIEKNKNVFNSCYETE